MSPADRPAHGDVGPTEVEEMLLRLVRSDEHRSLLAERVATARLDAEESLERVDAEPCAQPLLVAVPGELLAHRFGHPPSVGEPELREHGARRGQPEVLDQVLPQEPHRDRVEQERALSREANDPAFRVELEELLVIQVRCAHFRSHRSDGVPISF